MTADQIIKALDLPEGTRVDKRVPKTLLLEHGAPTAADKRSINEGIERIQWLAALKPTMIGVNAHRDEVREYLEISILHLLLRSAAKVQRLRELVHRAVPYPLIAVIEQNENTEVSLAHKRWSQGEIGKMVLDGEVVAVDVPAEDDPIMSVFLAALSLSKQPRSSLWALYDSWLDALFALHASRHTGHFSIPINHDQSGKRREALHECTRLEAEMARLRNAAKKEKQMARQVALNLELKRVEAARTAALKKM